MSSVNISAQLPVADQYVAPLDDYVQFGYSGGDYLTWAGATFTWGSPTAAIKLWSTPPSTDYRMEVTEDVIGITALESRKPSVVALETLHIAETRRSNIVRNVLVSLNISEAYIDQIAFVLRVFETLAVSEVAGRSVTLPLSETFSIVESGNNRAITLGVSEALAVSEVFGRTVAYKLAIAEGLALGDALTKGVTLHKSEALDLYDEYLRMSNAVISDMILDSGDITLTDLMTMVNYGHAPGYTSFKDFIPGDYEFQKALFRVVLESSSTDRARLKAMRVDVDVPDVFDRGSGTITVAADGLYVAFARPFHIIPDITLTLKGGTVVAVPDVISSDESGFTAVLKNPSTGVRVTGTFTWAAHGY